MALLSSFGKEGVKLGLLTRKVDIEDTSTTSKYFAVTEFPKILTAGKNSFAFNGSQFLKDKSEIQVECLDSNNNSLYLEQAKSQESQFTDASKFVVSIHVYDETYNGPAKIILVGTTTKGEIVRWIGTVTIDKTLNNNSKVRFVNRPSLEVRPLLYPVVSLTRAAVDYPPPPVISQAAGYAVIRSYVKSVTLTGVGAGYTSVKVTVDNTGTGGSGCQLEATIAPDGSIESVTVVNGGSGYKKAPKISIGGTYTTKASAIAVLKSEVVDVVITKPGSGYTFVPEVVFTPVGGHGSGASATAIVQNGKVIDVTIDQPDGGGDGYTEVPAVSFTVPNAPPPPDMNVWVSFSASFSSYGATPPTDTNKNTINPKQTDIDYRLVITSSAFSPLTPADLGSMTFPYKVFNTQMEGHPITLHITKIKKPYSRENISVNITSSFTIKKVLNSTTIQLNDPFYYTIGKNQFVANIIEGRCFAPYRFILYNTAPDSSQFYQVSPSVALPVKDSYAEVIYRNIKCFTGFVARHKIYRKSSYFPGDFQLVSEELLTPPELLSDQVTFNKFYDRLGVFYNQPHVNKYWFSETPNFKLYHSTNPINSMRVQMDSFTYADGTKGIIVKNDTLGGVNDSIYRAYNASEYARLSGSSYNSNFISLKKDVLYVLGTNISLEKNASETDAKVSFYFTSSIPSIKNEKTYDATLKKLKLGEISTKDKVSIKYFNDRQYIYFTPQDDYYGTLVIVPYKCSPTLSDISLKVYADYGFSGDCQEIRIPFDVKTANEAFDIRSELLDLNSVIVYSELRTVQSFDPGGESLVGKTNTSNINTNITIVQGNNGGGGSVTVTGEPYFPDLTLCDTTTRFVGWHATTGDSTTDGKLCYTNVARLFVSSSEYIQLHEYQAGVEVVGKAIAVQYDLENGMGRKIFIDAFGTKEIYP